MDDIGSVAVACQRHFEVLKASLHAANGELTRQMSFRAIDNEHARFKIWAGNLGALKRGRSSLDTRLRDSIVLRAAVLKFLGQLQDTLMKSV